MGSRAERTRSEVEAGGPSEVADCGAGWAKLQVAVRQQLVDRVTDRTTQSSSVGKYNLKPLTENTRGG